ncbi:PQQ-binding-like beta-propeller repeat protein [Streptomyces sp. NPDC056411]|uniref:outer membrane protein assembly factor BamB family protein n=1 Tax=Streptomyces sp. NPDC056411 TaxID=3345813 RepID=UPI0035D54DB7
MPLILVIVFVVLVATGVGGYFVLTAGDSDSPEDQKPANAMPQLWEAKQPASEEDHDLAQDGMRSMWANDNAVIYGDSQGVRAFNRETGKKEWTVKPPKGAGEVCGMSSTTSDDGVGAVVFDAGGDDCAFLSAVDSDTGRTLWSKNLKGRHTEREPEVVVNGKTLGAAIGDTYAGFSITGGREQWSVEARGDFCTTSTGLSSQYLAISSDCSDAKPKQQLSIHDLEYPSIQSKQAGEKRGIERTLADEPLTLLMQEGDGPEPERSIQTFNKDLKPDHSVKLDGDLKDLDFQPRTTFVDEEEQVLVTAYRNNTGMAAVDLKNGKLLWKKSEAAAVTMGEDGVVALAGPGAGGQDPRLLSIDLNTGKERVMGTLYDPQHQFGSPMMLSAEWNDNIHTLVVEGRMLDNQQVIRGYKLPHS